MIDHNFLTLGKSAVLSVSLFLASLLAVTIEWVQLASALASFVVAALAIYRHFTKKK